VGDYRVKPTLDHRDRLYRGYYRARCVTGSKQSVGLHPDDCAWDCWAFLSTFIGQTIGWYRLDQGAGLIGGTIGAVVVLFIWNRLVAHRVLSDPGNPTNVPPTRRSL
jgi:hypothetical protein